MRKFLDDPSIQGHGFLQFFFCGVAVIEGAVQVGLGGLMFEDQRFLFMLVFEPDKYPEKHHHQDRYDDSGDERSTMAFGKKPHPFTSG